MTASREMPKYECHKTVWALKIAEVTENGEAPVLVFAGKSYGPLAVDWDWYYKHKPEAGGYYVVYKDGYKSFRPAEAFEDGYKRIAA